MHAFDEAIRGDDFERVPLWLNDRRVIANGDGHEIQRRGRHARPDALDQQVLANVADRRAGWRRPDVGSSGRSGIRRLELDIVSGRTLHQVPSVS